MHVDMPTPVGAAVSVRLTGAGNALFSIEGRLDGRACRKASIMLRALVDAGARQVIVDLGAVPDASPLLELLASVRAELRRRGGVLLVAGGPDDAVEPASLVEAFDVYRRTVATSVAVRRTVVGVPA